MEMSAVCNFEQQKQEKQEKRKEGKKKKQKQKLYIKMIRQT